MGMRRYCFRDQYGRHEDQHPKQRCVLNLLEQGFHGGAVSISNATAETPIPSPDRY
jgi:hypothetical protein